MIVLRGGTVIDGTGAARVKADVTIDGDRIASIGAASASDATVVDVSGLIVAPGFIDVHNHSDGWLLKEPHQVAKTTQGITSELLMSDGISYAPLSDETRHEWMYYLKTLDVLEQVDYCGWRSIADYMSLLDRRMAQNAIAQVPYANVRTLAMGWSRSVPDDTQIRVMQQEIRVAMEQGATGVSTGLDYVNQCFATTDELAEVCSALEPYAGIYVTHVRYKKGTLNGIREAVEIGRRAGCKVHISHLKGTTAEEIDEILTYIDRVAVHEVDFSYDAYPYMPGSTMLNYFLPYEVWENGPTGVLNKLGSRAVRRKLRSFFESVHAPQLDKVFFAWVASQSNRSWQGKTLAEYVASTGQDVADAICNLLIDENLRVLMVVHLDEDQLIEPIIAHDRFMLGSDGIDQPGGLVHPRQFGSAPRILGPLVRDRKLFSLEKGVQKMTSIPAARFGLAGRGVLAPGKFADVVVFNEQTIGDRATYSNPRQHSVGVEHVLVNGQWVIQGGKPIESFEGDWPGRALKRNAIET